MTSEQLVDRLKHLAAEHGPRLTVRRFCRLAGIGDGIIYDRFPGGWRDLRAAAGLEPRVGPAAEWTDEELLRDFADLAARLGRTPRWTEIDRLAVASASTYQRRFGSMRELVRAAEAVHGPLGYSAEELERYLRCLESAMPTPEERAAGSPYDSLPPPPMPLLHVVLYQPDIPQNTGNIGRSCVAVGAKLWLVRPLGFRLDDRSLKRAGMDYWQHLDWEAVESIEEVKERLPENRVWCVEESGTRPVWEADFRPGDVLLFGSETRGLPQRLLDEEPSRNLFLPMYPQVRSLNLASTANTVIYEAVRQFGGLPGGAAGRESKVE